MQQQKKQLHKNLSHCATEEVTTAKAAMQKHKQQFKDSEICFLFKQPIQNAKLYWRQNIILMK